MTSRRSPDFDLRHAVGLAGFTPRASDVPGLVALLADDDTQRDAERALERLGPAVADRLIDAARRADPPLRGRLVRALGRVADQPLPLFAFLGDGDAPTRRAAARALARHASPAVEAALLARLPHATTADLRPLVDTLGKVGGPAALAAIGALPAADPELARLAAQARLRLERASPRGEGGRILDDVAPAAPLAVRALCRAGLERFLAEELGGSVRGPGAVAATLDGPLPTLWRARTMLRFGFPVAGAPAEALSSDAARAILARFTAGPIRYRLAFASGHRRAEVLRIATAVRSLRPDLINDPTASLWEAEIGDGEVILVPKALDDPRFAYRRRDVPASSHPTIAAALARAAGSRPDDVVWDPFVGAAAEIVERARLGPATALHGSDVSAAALDAAAENLRAAGVSATLRRADALSFAPAGVSLILTNPPMGRRVAADAGLLLDFVAHAARALRPGGRLVWMSPLPERTVAAARDNGLQPRLRQAVDMGGFFAELQVFIKKMATKKKSPSI